MDIKQVDSKYAAEFLENHKNSRLIDVRTENEWLNTGLPLKDSQQLVLLSWRVLPSMEINPEFEKIFRLTDLNKDDNLFFICKSGGRSQEAIKFVMSLGYNNCYNVADGFEGINSSTGWKNNNLNCHEFKKLPVNSENLIKDSNFYNRIWKLTDQDLNKHYGEALYKSWFSKISFLDFSTNNIILAAPTNFIRDWIKSNYLSHIVQFIQHHDPKIKTVEIITKEVIPEVSASNDSNEKSLKNSNSENNTANIFSTLDPRFTFENFVVGSPNALAYAAAKAVAESKTAVAESNPLFLYGGVGHGKTHLMHAISWDIKQNNPSRKVIYMSAEQFMYQFVKALRNKDVMSFKEEFRSVDVLMIDDIQFICGKDSTQEEFFHTFNALIDNKRQMVISCDRSPSDLDNIEDRIRSRLGMGLVADVHSTTYELRLGIIESKLEQMNITIPKNVIEFLASKITSNVRELEGALNKVIAHSTLVGREITLEATQDILRDLLRSNERIITIEDIQRKVAEKYNIKVSDMSSIRRVREIARPRQIGMYLAKILTPKSLTEIGKKFGKKDHTTVIHAIKNVEKLTGSDKELREEVNLLTRILQN